MTVVAASQPSDLRRIPSVKISHHRRRRFPAIFISMTRDDSKIDSDVKKEKIGFSTDRPPTVRQLVTSSEPHDLSFDRLQPSDEDCDCKNRRDFGRFIAREALNDEELWTASWLRAETEWENKSNVRHVDSFKKKFADQEFHALKRRSTAQFMHKSTCIVAVKKEAKNVKRTVLSSIVGTLDLSIRRLSSGETFPGERINAPIFCFTSGNQREYAYISSLCVAKYARRQGIASNMLLLAIEAAKCYGVNEIYIQVHKDNLSARNLYEKMGFEVVEAAVSQYLKEEKYLLCYNICSYSS